MARDERPYIEKLIDDVRHNRRRDLPLSTTTVEPHHIPQIAAAIRESGQVTHFNMTWKESTADEYAPLLEALADCSRLRTIRLDGNWIGDRHADKVAQVLQANPHIRMFSLTDTGITGKGLQSITHALQGSESLEMVSVNCNPLGDSGAEALTTLLDSCPYLRSVTAEDCGITDSGLLHIASSLGKRTDIAECALKRNDVTPVAVESLRQSVIASGTKNLVKPPLEGDGELSRFCKANQDAAYKAQEMLEDNHFDDHAEVYDLDAVEVATIAEYLPALEFISEEDACEYFREYLEDLPRFAELERPLSMAALKERKWTGICPLDSPDLWQHFDVLADELAQAGEPITHDTLAEMNHNRETFLTLGLVFAPEKVLETLNAAGLHVGHEQLIREDGKPSHCLVSMTKRGTVQALFCEANWKDRPLQELRDTYHALPDDARAQVGNFNSLCIRLSQPQHDAGRGR